MSKQMTIVSEIQRVMSFRMGWISPICSIEMARAGFVYLGHDKIVQCTFCLIIISEWAKDDNPMLRHLAENPNCPFIKDPDSVGNVSYTGNYSFPEKDALPLCYQMRTREARMKSFRNWKSAVSVDLLIDAGFFYNGEKDFTTCYFCRGTLGHWNSTDDPKKEHDKHFFWCCYKKKLYEETLELDNIKEKPYLCKICFENNLEIMFIPCGHVVCCRDCNTRILFCPICKREVKQTKRAYIV